MTQALYLKDPYLKEFETTVLEVNNKFIILDKTLFYPNSGGQPNDTGKLINLATNEEFEVVFVKKIKNNISHEVDKEGLKEDDKVKGILNWDKRYYFMRAHTSAHVISAVIFNETKAQITGNQLSEDKIRIDFNLENFNREQIKDFETKSNELLSKDLPVLTYFLPTDEAFKIPEVFRLKNVLPPTIKEIRIVEIQDFDKQACGGTHINNLKEIGKIEMIKAENKGKDNRRIYYKII